MQQNDVEQGPQMDLKRTNVFVDQPSLGQILLPPSAAHLLLEPALTQGVIPLLHFFNVDIGQGSFNSSGIFSWQTP